MNGRQGSPGRAEAYLKDGRPGRCARICSARRRRQRKPLILRGGSFPAQENTLILRGEAFPGQKSRAGLVGEPSPTQDDLLFTPDGREFLFWEPFLMRPDGAFLRGERSPAQEGAALLLGEGLPRDYRVSAGLSGASFPRLRAWKRMASQRRRGCSPSARRSRPDFSQRRRTSRRSAWTLSRYE